MLAMYRDSLPEIAIVGKQPPAPFGISINGQWRKMFLRVDAPLIGRCPGRWQQCRAPSLLILLLGTPKPLPQIAHIHSQKLSDCGAKQA
jgi:hypothetical protein